MKLGMKRLAVLVGATALVGALAVPNAGAVQVGPLEASIDVDTSSWEAWGIVEDDLTNATYTTVLTATGYETDGTRNGTIIDFDTATGNPAHTHTIGGFDSDYAVVEYTLTWTSVLGTTGSFSRTCVEVLNTPICTVR